MVDLSSTIIDVAYQDWRSRFVQGDISDCWTWIGQLYEGYGRYGQLAGHRIVYENLVGEIPDGLVLDHTCLNTKCVNPFHLDPVTIGENVRRARALSRKETCPHGHPYVGSNLYINPNTGARLCKACGATNNVRQAIRRRKK